MTGLKKPWKKDSELDEESLHIMSYAQPNVTSRRSGIISPLTQDTHDDYYMRIIEILIDHIDDLEKKYAKLDERLDRMEALEISSQSRDSLSDLADLAGFNTSDTFDPYELEGILSNYSDSQSSTDWIQDVRNET